MWDDINYHNNSAVFFVLLGSNVVGSSLPPMMSTPSCRMLPPLVPANRRGSSRLDLRTQITQVNSSPSWDRISPISLERCGFVFGGEGKNKGIGRGGGTCTGSASAVSTALPYVVDSRSHKNDGTNN